jgi:CrcB protein
VTGLSRARSERRAAAAPSDLLVARWGVAHVRTASIMLGGALGALARAGVAEALPAAPGTWPWATFVVNLAGTVLLAWLTTRLAETVAPTRFWRFLLGTGAAGALTTFSTLQVETIQLARDAGVGLAAGNAAASIAAGLLLAAGTTVLARRRRYG